MAAPKIVVFAGSAHSNSINKKLAKVAAAIAEAEGFEVTHLDLADFEAPVYNADYEEKNGLPPSMLSLIHI